jgi:hypothetical protein
MSSRFVRGQINHHQSNEISVLHASRTLPAFHIYYSTVLSSIHLEYLFRHRWRGVSNVNHLINKSMEHANRQVIRKIN